MAPAVPDTLLTETRRRQDRFSRPTLVQKIYKYFAESNDVKPAKKFDFSIIGGPYYSSDTKLGIGIVAAGLYRRNLNDTVNPAGQVNIYGDLSITKYYKIGVRGSQFFSGKKYRMAYDLSFESMPDKFWGIGYKMASKNSNMSEYKRWHGELDASFLINIWKPGLYLGPRVLLDYLDGRDIKKPQLWNNQQHRTFTNAIGLAVEFDSRDNVFNAYKGVYVRLDQLFAPKFIGNKYAFSSTELTVSYYRRLWKTGVLAGCFHTRLTYGNTPWGLMSKLGGSYTMRGYWEGRYNDKCAA
ncbi:MAG: BamA/TamA family outer membrane protein, partial [Muribaculaceae bacterium]|nr:BamA/TamA family outer membrane protein [Muribaculaceae bacterium]